MQQKHITEEAAGNDHAVVGKQIEAEQRVPVSQGGLSPTERIVSEDAERLENPFGTSIKASSTTVPRWLERKRAQQRKFQTTELWDEQTFVSLLRNYQRANMHYLWVRLVFFFGSILGVLPGMVLSAFHIVNPMWNQFAGWVVMLLGIAVMTTLFLNKRAGRALRQFRDPRALQPLLRMLADDTPEFLSDVKMRAQVKQALTPLLPRLRAEDAASIHWYDWQGLGKNLGLEDADKDEPFQTASLQTISRLGVTRLLPVVKQMAGAQARTDAQGRVRAVAQECLSSLRANEEKASAAQTLVRAASIMDLPEDTLLRPARASLTTDPEELLRPDTAENPNLPVENPLPARCIDEEEGSLLATGVFFHKCKVGVVKCMNKVKE